MSDLIPHIPALRRFARSLSKNQHDADDLVQITLEKAMKKWRFFRRESSIYTWLCSILYHSYLDEFIKKAEYRFTHISTEQQTEYEVEAELYAVSSESHEQSLQAVKDAMICLEPEQRAVLALVVLEGFSYAQVAKITNTPTGTVMSRLHRARDKLSAFMQQQSRPQDSNSKIVNFRK